MMKAYRRLIVIFFVVSCVLIAMIIFKKEPPRYLMVMGDNISYGSKYQNQIVSYGDLLYKKIYENNKMVGYDDSFAIPNLTSSTLLEMINKDASNNKQKISKYFKKSKCIIVSIGINDILNQLFYDKETGNLEYDEDSIYTQIYIIGQNIHQIIGYIRHYNSHCSLLFMGYSSYIKTSSFSKLVEKINTTINL